MSWTSRILASVLVMTAVAQPSQAGELMVIASGSQPSQPRQPQLALDKQGTIHVAFGVGNAIYHARSLAGGRQFAPPQKIGETPRLALGMRRGPRIAAGSEAIVVAAIGHEEGNLLAWRSTDGGRAWQGPVQVNDSPHDAREGLHAMAQGPQGELYCVWLDCREQERGKRIFGAGSTDGGKTWSANQLVYTSPSGSVCECCHPSATYDSLGKLHVMWRNSISGARDMYWASSMDGGKTFGKATKLGQGTWPLNACPMDGGNLTASPKGELFTAWRRDKEVFLAGDSGTPEQRLALGKQPWIAATARGPHVVWLEDRSTRLMYQSPGAAQAEELAAKANDPVIVSAPGGAGPLVAAWEESQGKETRLVCRVLAEGK